MSVYLFDSWEVDDYFSYQFDSNIYKIKFADIADKYENIWGLPLKDKLFKINKIFFHDSNSFQLKLTCSTDNDSSNESCGISDLFILID